MATTTTESQKTDTKPKQRSYFTKDVVNRYVLDDGESYIEHIKLDEGLFQQYQDITSKIKLDRTGVSTEVDMALGKQRKFLLENLVTGWNLVDENDKLIKFQVAKLLELPPHVITGLVGDIYAKNEILNSDTDEEGKD